MREYRIAFFTVDWNCELVENTMRGLKKFIEEHENVRVCVFDCFGDETDNARSRIEYGIFTLADLSRFDGLLIQGNQVVLERARTQIAKLAARTKIPAISIDCPIEGCRLLALDHRSAQRDITRHVIREHGARTLVYLTGILNNGSPSGILRREGFLEACREEGIDSRDIQIVEGTWKPEDGTKTAKLWIEEKRTLPDAFICANDEMALAMIEQFSAHRIRVPQDVMITGFDNVSSAVLSDPQLTTVNRDFDDATYTAMQTILDIIDGKEVPDRIPLHYQVIASESCGCEAAVKPQDTKRRYFQRSRYLKWFHMQQAKLAEPLLDVADLPRLMALVEEFPEVFGGGCAYLCVNDYYFDNYDKDRVFHDTGAFGEQMVLAGRQADGEIACVRFPSQDLLPDEILKRERFLVFYPIHYNTRSIGYLVMNDIGEAAQMNLHRNLFSFLEIAVENVRKKGLLRHLNQMLDRLYVKDRLTGLFNRSGYERFGRSVWEYYRKHDGGAQIVFIDMDGLKTINDLYGHESGDEAITECAEVLRSVCGERDFVMRYGGDEFLVITSILRSGLEQELTEALRKVREKKKRPFDLSMSFGIIRAEEDKPLDAYIQEADALMYQNKKRRRRVREQG